MELNTKDVEGPNSSKPNKLTNLLQIATLGAALILLNPQKVEAAESQQQSQQVSIDELSQIPSAIPGVKETLASYKSLGNSSFSGFKGIAGYTMLNEQTSSRFVANDATLAPKVSFKDLTGFDNMTPTSYKKIVAILTQIIDKNGSRLDKGDDEIWRRKPDGSKFSQVQLKNVRDLQFVTAANYEFLADKDKKLAVASMTIFNEILPQISPEYNSRIGYYVALRAAAAIAYYMQSDDKIRSEVSLDLLNQISDVLVITGVAGTGSIIKLELSLPDGKKVSINLPRQELLQKSPILSTKGLERVIQQALETGLDRSLRLDFLLADLGLAIDNYKAMKEKTAQMKDETEASGLIKELLILISSYKKGNEEGLRAILDRYGEVQKSVAKVGGKSEVLNKWYGALTSIIDKLKKA